MRIVNTETDIKYNLSIRPLITILLRVPILLILPTRFKKTRNFKKPRDFENHKSSKFEHFGNLCQILLLQNFTSNQVKIRGLRF